jgi:hypothetical protein
VMAVAAVLAASLLIAVLLPRGEAIFHTVNPVGRSRVLAGTTNRPHSASATPDRVGSKRHPSTWDVAIYRWANGPSGPPEPVALCLLGHAPQSIRRRTAAREVLALELANASPIGANAAVNRAALSLRPRPRSQPSPGHDVPAPGRRAAHHFGRLTRPLGPIQVRPVESQLGPESALESKCVRSI